VVTSPDNDPGSSATRDDLPTIRGFIPSTLIDWPGRIAAIVFLPACNLRCAYCHAGDLLEPASDEVIPWPQVRRYLDGKRAWIDGVVICGGEPTLHATLANLCREIRALGLAVKLDTNGTRPDVLQRLIDQRLIDAVSMDLKTTLDGRMVELARADVDLEAIDRSISLLLDASATGAPAPTVDDRAPPAVVGDAEHCRKPDRDAPPAAGLPRSAAPPAAVEVEFRTTCCPAYVDVDVIRWIARRIGPTPQRPGGSTYVLQRFEPEHALDPACREVAPYSATEMDALLAAARAINPNSRLRTG
jgi:pyruvate formate lyase activating enzyme